MKRINLGCGDYKLRGYINCDIRKEVNPDLCFDVLKGIPLRNDSIDEIVATEFLEHFAWRNEVYKCLSEIVRVLKKGGRAYFKVPNLKVSCEGFLKKVPRRIEFIFGGQRNPFDFHKAGWDKESFEALLKEYFSKIAVREEGRSLVAECNK